jgi:hypothetical protein
MPDIVSAFRKMSTKAGQTQYEYTADRELEIITRPDELDLTLQYQTGSGRLESVTQSRGETEIAYHPTSGYVSSISSPDTVTVHLAYNGPLVATESWNGKVEGYIRRSHTRDFLPESIAVVAGSEIHNLINSYDDDGLLREVAGPEGTLTITRRATDGLVSGTTLGNVTTTQDYTPHGDLKLYAARFNTDTLYRASYDHDQLGRDLPPKAGADHDASLCGLRIAA